MEEEQQVIAYLRLSREDEREGESRSIENQRKLIVNYLEKSKPYENYRLREFIDDGKTGTGSSRPGLLSMVQAIKDQSVTCVVIKDFSRLYRNHVHTGYFVEEFLPSMGVRLISIEDGYDSLEKGGSQEFNLPLLALLNEWYSRDLSMKIRSAKRQMALQGRPASGGCPYGYMRGTKEDSAYQKDHEAAAVVGFIFHQAYAGISRKEIAEDLNRKQIPPPGVYKKKKRNSFSQEELAGVWDGSKVSRILGDERYIGTMITGRYTSMGFGTGKTVKKNKEMWNVFEKHHVPLVSEYCFSQVNIRKPKQFQRSKMHPFFGIIHCDHCSKRLYHKRNKFTCQSGCFKKKLEEEKLQKGIKIFLEILIPGIFKNQCYVNSDFDIYRGLICQFVDKIEVFDFRSLSITFSFNCLFFAKTLENTGV